MPRLTRCLLALLLAVGFSLAEAPKTDKLADPVLDEFKTVDTCAKTSLKRSTQPETTTNQPAYLGVHVEKNGTGLVISQVEPDSPAAKAGLAVGDVFREFGGKSVRDLDHLRDLLMTVTPGQKQKVAVLRKEKPVSVEVALAAVSSPLSETTTTTARAVLGVQVEAEKGGVKLTSVTADSAAAKAGLKVGDLVVKLEGKETAGVESFRDLLSSKKPGDEVTLIVQRDGKEETFKAKLGSEPSGDSGRIGREGWDSRRTGAWKSDVYRLAIVGVEFPDVKHNPNITAKDWETALFSKGAYNDKSVTGQKVFGSMNDYYQEISCGKFRVTGKMFEYVEVKNKRDTYGATGNSKTALLTEAVDKVLVRDGKDAFKDFDGIFFLYAGGRAQAQRGGLFWPHRSSFRHNGKNWSYFICPEGGSKMDSISVIAHEFGHMLGLPDLYARPERPGEEGVGVWCTMSTGHGRDGKPLHFSAWCKEQLGWLKPAIIDPTVKQKLVLSPIQGSEKECYKVLVKPDGSEYLLLENRFKRGYDQNLPAEGLLIWRVVNGRPILEESHGVAGPNGPSRFLGSVPYPSKSNSAFTPYTTPSSKPLTGGGSPVHITNIRKLPDGRITFFIGYEYF